nr:hypothetical protein [Tanacetum cinerariifolium]
MSTSNNLTNSNQQTLADSRANKRPPMLEKGNYIPWESRLRRFLDNKLENRERMWNSIQNGPYQRPMVVDPTNPPILILKPLSKMTEVQFEPHVLASRAKKAANNHDPLALIAHSNASSSRSHANSSYSLQPYYVTHSLSVVDYGDEYQGELQGYGGNANKNAGRNKTQGFNTRTAAMKDEAGSNLSNEENDFMLDTSYGEDLEELTAAFMNLPDPGELISSLNSGIRKNLSSTTCKNLPVEDDHSPLLAYVVWIFLAYLHPGQLISSLNFGIRENISSTTCVNSPIEDDHSPLLAVMTYEKVRPIFEREYNKVQTLFIPNKDVEEPLKKRVAEETLLQQSFKKLNSVEVSGSESTQETPTNDLKQMSEEDVKNMLEIFPISEFMVEALQVKYLLIDWEIHSKGSRS